jgi:U3 small nucleolar RNA-associated protein 14
VAFPQTEADEVAAEEWKGEEEDESGGTDMKGWGSWAGSGINPPRRPVVPKYKTDKIIPGPSNDRKAAKYQVKRLPFPYKSAKEFDFAHKLPLGKDWNTQTMHNTLI